MALKGQNRRYRVGIHPIYDRTFDRLHKESLILTGKAGRDIQNFGTYAMMREKRGILRLLEEREGTNGAGYFKQNRRDVPSKLTECQMALDSIKEMFEKRKQRQINAGHYPSEKMNDEEMEKLLQAEAREDICKTEIKHLRHALEHFQEAEAKEEEPCLKRGPIGSSRLRGGICVWIDFQDVEPDSEGVLRIKDTRSPYNGMRVADYFRHIVKSYKQQEAALINEHAKAVQEAAREGVDTASILKKRPPLPEWPEAVERFQWE